MVAINSRNNNEKATTVEAKKETVSKSHQKGGIT